MLLITAAAMVALAGLGFAGVYVTQFSGSHVSAVSLAPTSPRTSASVTPAAGTGTGAWTVTSGSFAGYRVREQFAGLTASSDAVGRTSSLTGSVTLTQSGPSYTVTTAAITVDVTTLASDKAMRDRRIHQMGLESDRYPTATFTLATPIVLSAAASSGQVIQVSATGNLTLHGTTRTVTIPMQAQLSGSQIKLSGSLTFPFSEFNMTPPSVGGFVTVEENATMEFLLMLQHA